MRINQAVHLGAYCIRWYGSYLILLCWSTAAEETIAREAVAALPAVGFSNTSSRTQHPNVISYIIKGVLSAIKYS